MARWLGSMLMLLLLVACTEDNSDEPQGGNLHLSMVTRANTTLEPNANSKIKLFVTTKDAQFSVGGFNWETNDESSSWKNYDVRVGEHAQYYIYGYMPNKADVVECSSIAKPAGGDFSNGADMTLTGLPMFPEDDICVVVGVQRITSATPTPAAAEGNYGYLSGLNSENYVNLLMDHLYSQLILQFNVDATYNALRHIKLKAVKLTSTYGEKVNATIRFRAGNYLDINSVTYSKNTSGEDNKELQVLEGNAQFLTTTATDTSFGPFNCAPCTFDANGTKLTLTCTYDVYDTNVTSEHPNGNLIREDCTATNKLKVTNMIQGVKKTLTITIAPTYLYVLSDDDLNNPTIKIQ